ncbi:hypothetical protein [Leifsonia sp. Root4]|uniref:hypothetical protein n=1 Tax=Leifsonia sp. Root4 TaxID=1736525 RepID=UPI000AE823D4|nr:hypothetical protein [Leifsonia sp. Root4]
MSQALNGLDDIGYSADSRKVGSLMDHAAQALLDARLEAVAFDFNTWRKVVESTLAPADREFDPFGIANKGLLRRASELLAPSHRAELAIALGSFAKTVQLRSALGMHSNNDSLRLLRGALSAYSAVSCDDFTPSSSGILMTPLALWTLGLLDQDNLTRRLHHPDKFGRSEMKQLARQSGWTAMLAAERVADVRWLLRPDPTLGKTVDLILNGAPESEALVESVVLANSRAAHVAHGPAGPVVSAHHLDDPNVAWLDGSAFGPDAMAVLKQLSIISGDRSDLLILENSFIVVEAQGFMDALLALAVGTADDKRNSTWHERAVHREVRKTWRQRGRVIANIAWATSLPENLMVDPPKVAGEFDSLVLDDRIAIDLQAKSSRSTSAASREKLPVSEALKQHEGLLALAGQGEPFWLLSDGRKTTKKARAEKIETSNREFIAITVGTDVVHRWLVGGSKERDGVARVLTTLDHMRIVNHYIPEPLRPVYWLDRYAQEFDPMRFVDEIDYLVKWHKWLALGSGSGGIHVMEGFVLATDSEIEADIALRNNVLAVKNPDPRLIDLLNRSRAQIVRMNSSLEPVCRVLGLASVRGSKDYWRFARALVGNPPTAVREAMASKSQFILHEGLAQIVVHPGTLSSTAIREYQAGGVSMVLAREGGSWRLETIEGAGAEPLSFRAPRFDSTWAQPLPEP